MADADSTPLASVAAKSTSRSAAARPALSGTRLSDRWRLVLVWLVLLIVPFVAPNAYLVSLANMMLINIILIASLNLLVGYGGQISLGHAGFYGLGAYVSGVLNVKFGLNAWAGLPAAAFLTGLAALVIGIPALRLRGLYLSMATLGWNAILVVMFNRLIDVTGGPNGLLGVKPFALGALKLDTDARQFPLLWLVSFVVMLAILNLLSSRIGRALRAVATNELGADAVGIDSFRTKLLVFVLSAGMAGIAGSLYVHVNQYASPDTFSVSNSILLVVMVAIGGSGLYWGPILGALIYTAVPQLLLDYEDVELMLFGLAMIVVLLVAPGGLAGLPAVLRRRLARRRPL
ncbi:branched-chain amino acid ABC transporter permease [Bradyrhizobium sp.]|uniref:branched-chain amino acid ABC transporter permease n=1 Tax=Bradyrhizobium sp. TaxID=376 RepID=UPI003C59ED43